MKNRKSANKKLLDNVSLEIEILIKYRAFNIFKKYRESREIRGALQPSLKFRVFIKLGAYREHLFPKL